MELSQKQKNFFWIFFCIFEIYFNFWTISKKKMTLIGDVFLKLRTPKNVVRSMSKKSRFRRPFEKQHGKLAQTLIKSERQHL